MTTRVVRAAGISISRSKGKELAKVLELEMAKELMKCLEEQITDPSTQRARILKRRDEILEEQA